MFLFVLKSILKGKSLVRSLMNFELKKYSVNGKVLDIGGGKNPSYFNYLQKKDNPEIFNLDLYHSKNKAVDFEKDSLPYGSGEIDQVLMFNILEHIYNHKFLVGEVFRVLKNGGTVLGFVPFLINYHPDPHDYFRYTKESLDLIFKEIGFGKIEIRAIGLGPFAVGFNSLVPSFPRIINALLLPIIWFLDFIFKKFRPNITERFPLGYSFVLEK